MFFLITNTAVVKLNHSYWNLYMKLIKFIAAAALVASTSFISGGQSTSFGSTQTIAAPCHNWPFCRDVEIVESASEQPQYLAAPCHNWPFCRDVEIIEPSLGLKSQAETIVLRKSA